METPNDLKEHEIDRCKDDLISICKRYSSAFGDTAPVSTMTELLNDYMLKDDLTIDGLMQTTASVIGVIDFITDVYTHVISLETTQRLYS